MTVAKARQSETQPQIREVTIVDFVQKLRTETVEAALDADPLCADIATTLRDLLLQMQQCRTGAALICKGALLVGIFTEHDMLAVVARGESLDAPISTCMTRDPTTINRSASLAAAIRTMSVGGYRQLPVVDEQGRPCGLVKVKGIVHYLVEHFPQAVYNLPPKLQLQGREGA